MIILVIKIINKFYSIKFGKTNFKLIKYKWTKHKKIIN